MLMDDTVIMATTYDKLITKLNILVESCDRSGMVINEDKTKFMVFCSSLQDPRPIILSPQAGCVTVKHCTQYTYLGSIVTSDGKVKSSVEKHATSRVNAMNKLIRFLDKNKNAPYEVKKNVVDACFTSSILYGCEAWLGVKPCKAISTMYMKSIKMLLGVRNQTTNDVCLIESGYPSLEALVQSRQKIFLQKKICERVDMEDDPLIFALHLTRSDNPVMTKYIDTLLNEQGDIIEMDITRRKERIKSSERSKMVSYRNINPTFEIHSIYKPGLIVEDYLRTAFTRFRVSSHRLRIEVGRWSRIPREARLCQCGVEVQTEEHVLTRCNLVDPIRQKYGYGNINFDTFMRDKKSKPELLMLYEIIKLLEK